MAWDELYLSTVPIEEPCLQLSKATYDQMRQEAAAYRDALVKKFNLDGREDIRIVVRTEHHDFGSYPVILVKYNEASIEAENLAYDIETNEPNTWAELGMTRPMPELDHLRGG